jgi:uncharacterized ion transporter superfamily protein YfcC
MVVNGVSPVVFILLLLVFFLVFLIFNQSSPGMAVLTIPIIGALPVLVNVPGTEIVNSQINRMAIMPFRQNNYFTA